MAWTIEIERDAQKDIAKLDRTVAKRILSFLFDRLSKLEDPHSIGEPLHGSKFGELWKYRVGDYRIIANLNDGRLIIVVVRVGHRREVYR